ncbi:MAG: N-acetylmuramoyl-L-alanine amidase [Clostridiaceae bacterium]
MKTCTVNYGHTLTGGDIGARGLNGLKEEVLTREVGRELKNILQAEGIIVRESFVDYAATLNDSLNKQVAMCNTPLSDINICIHFNAFKDATANGTEIYTYNGNQLIEANRILNKLSSLGFKNRGIKNQSLALINRTIAKTIYIEVCFITNSHDAAILNKYKPYGIAKTIAEGLLNKTIATPNLNKYDESIPEGVFKIPNTTGYIEQATDGRLIIHKDRGNYIAIGQGFIDLYWNDNNGKTGKKRLSE